MPSGFPDYQAFEIPVLVPSGGTGHTSLTVNGVLLGAGTAPVTVAAAGAPHTVFCVPGGGGAPSFAASLSLAEATAGTVALGVRVSGNTQDRVQIYADGRLAWGDGSGALDTVLERTGAAQAMFTADLVLRRENATDETLETSLRGHSYSPFIVYGSGKLAWGSGDAATDVTLYRNAVGALALTGALAASSLSLTTPLPVASGGTGSATGSITGSGALTFAAGGSNQNVTLTPSGSGYTILNGKVGIGTSSPGNPLDISSAASTKLLLTGGATQNGMLFDAVGGVDQFYLYSGAPFVAGWGIYDVTAGLSRLVVANSGRVVIGHTLSAPTAMLQVLGLEEYADNTAAVAGGLTVGAFYRTGDSLKIVH